MWSCNGRVNLGGGPAATLNTLLGAVKVKAKDPPFGARAAPSSRRAADGARVPSRTGWRTSFTRRSQGYSAVVRAPGLGRVVRRSAGSLCGSAPNAWPVLGHELLAAAPPLDDGVAVPVLVQVGVLN